MDLMPDSTLLSMLLVRVTKYMYQLIGFCHLTPGLLEVNLLFPLRDQLFVQVKVGTSKVG